MSGVVSGVATAKSVGLELNAVSAWLGAWGTSWVIAFPTLLLALPVVRRLVGIFVHRPGR